MKKIILVAAFAVISVFGAFAQENASVYFDPVHNMRFGYAGVLNSSDNNLMGGFEFGLNLFEFGVRPYSTGAISLGADFIVDEFNAAEGNYFLSEAHKTAIVSPLLSFKDIRGSRAGVLAFAFPLNFTQTIGGKLALTLGASAKVNLNAETTTDYISVFDDRCSQTVAGIHTNRLTYDIHLAVTYDDFGIYASYSPMKVFENGYGPDFNFFSVGAIFRIDE